MYAGPVADGIAALVAVLLVSKEMRAMKRLEQAKAPGL